MPPVWAAKTPDHGVAIGASILSAATATEVGAKGVSRQPWANAPFVPGPLADYMDSQFKFYNNKNVKTVPVMAGLNYFLTHGARGGTPGDKKLLGEKRDVISWLSWLERRANGDVKAISTPIGYIPTYEDMKNIFTQTIGKDYSKDLYEKHFSFYIDNMISKLDLQRAAYLKESGCPARIFEIYEEQKEGLMKLKAKYGAVVTPAQLIEAGGLC
jgi:phosphoenolpyruvate carboxykinase (GTP)